ncbi:heptose I phosphotransferase [Malonomonas rubra DSM 5091]|uniref:Heptose I phosphotransferase n=1 Tax=Malonomonas rubra DSM 5091 TaxID=1122189 RepID=A0A1M6C7E1_MALRU|nr:lipopolysaccharide core heptose(I) kinase RfaP [Malonomonas rubra]SHI56967.1 heptose I phosphotransferase [Malonomonas rubra DSM 5091]
MILLPEEWKERWKNKDLFEQVLGLQGEEYRNMDGRKTLRFEMDGKGYFAKLYPGIGWPRIFKSLLKLQKPPVLSAANECQAIHKLEELGVETMTLIGYGDRGRNPARRQSFIITEELINTESLEDFTRDWLVNPPAAQLKRTLIERLATISRLLHDNGVNHRDYYLCHFLLDVSFRSKGCDPDQLHLYLIDLHRVQFRKSLPFHWRLKDLSALYFSSMEIGLTQRDFYRFIRGYTQQPLPQAIKQHRRLWDKVEYRGGKLLKRFYRKYKS